MRTLHYVINDVAAGGLTKPAPGARQRARCGQPPFDHVCWSPDQRARSHCM